MTRPESNPTEFSMLKGLIVVVFVMHTLAVSAGNCFSSGDVKKPRSNLLDVPPYLGVPPQLHLGQSSPVLSAYDFCSSSHAYYPLTKRPKDRDMQYHFNVLDDELETMLVYTRAGQLWLKDSQTQQFQVLDTKGEAIRYVMDQHGHIYVSALEARVINYKNKYFTHASFFSGDVAAGAGMLAASIGVLTFLNRHTGHYKTPPKMFKQTLNELSARGISYSQKEIPIEKFSGFDLIPSDDVTPNPTSKSAWFLGAQQANFTDRNDYLDF